jgi:hypothetical protein
VIYQVSSSKVHIERWFNGRKEAIAAFERECKRLGLTSPSHYLPAVSGDTFSDDRTAYPPRSCAAGRRDGHGYVFVAHYQLEGKCAMKLPLFPLLVLCASSLHAQNAHGEGPHLRATQLRDECKKYVAVADGTLPKVERQLHAGSVGTCGGYVMGAADAFEVAMKSGVLPEPLQACVPKESTGDELIRVFLKFIDSHPEKLSNSAAEIVWQAIIASYLCPKK